MQNWCDSIWYWVKLQYKKSYFMSYLLCWRCLEMFVKRFEYFYVSALPGIQENIPVLTCYMWKKWFSKQNFETQFEFESHLVGPKSILKSLRKGNYLFFMISIWLDPKILIIWQKIQNLNDHFDSNQNWAQSKTRLKLKLSLELDLFWLNIKLSPKYWFKMIFFLIFF